MRVQHQENQIYTKIILSSIAVMIRLGLNQQSLKVCSVSLRGNLLLLSHQANDPGSHNKFNDPGIGQPYSD